MRAPDDRSQPLVSIGVAVYNGGATLARALDSLIQQDYPNIEIIVSDDCSTDRSREIIEQYHSRDRRIRVLNNDVNIGLIENFNKVFRAATGKYFFWADQDDIRDHTFVRKTVDVLENRPDAVLCHSYTGGFLGTPENTVVVVTLDGVADVKHPVVRYARFLRRFSDTTIYGLIRSEALRRTALWSADLGAANILLFELLLLGTFTQVPEVLYLYSGKGPGNRAGPRDEYERQNRGRRMPRFYVPFLVVAWSQQRAIVRARLSSLTKLGISAALWANVLSVNLAKIAYRSAHAIAGDRLPVTFVRLCQYCATRTSHLRFVGAGADRSLFPIGWMLRK